MSELALVNMNLPARVWLPLCSTPHHIVRIPYRSAAVLNSKEKAPYIMYVEVLTCDNVHTTALPPKLLDTNLRTDRSEGDLTLYSSSNSRNGSQANLQQLDKPVQASVGAGPICGSMEPVFLNKGRQQTNGINNLNIYNDSHADCWSIHSDSGLHLNSTQQTNYKNKNFNHQGKHMKTKNMLAKISFTFTAAIR